MPTVSEQLRRAREQQQRLDIYQGRRSHQDQDDHVRALGIGQFRDLFLRRFTSVVFVRTYGTMLKLDVPRLLAELEAELGRSERFRDPPPLTNAPRGALDFFMLQLSRLNWRNRFRRIWPFCSSPSGHHPDSKLALLNPTIRSNISSRAFTSSALVQGNDTLPLPTPAPTPAPR
jgi:hypothetical protein